MTPNEILDELLGQHAQLRAKIQAARAIARTGDGRRLQDALGEIAHSLRHHNLREEELLNDILPTVDTWGSIRAEVMVEQHVTEHTQLYEALLIVDTARGTEVAAVEAEALFAHILAHMDREEKVFLTPEALEGDETAVDGFDG